MGPVEKPQTDPNPGKVNLEHTIQRRSYCLVLGSKKQALPLQPRLALNPSLCFSFFNWEGRYAPRGSAHS